MSDPNVTSTTAHREQIATALREAADLLAALPDGVPTPSITAYGHVTTLDVSWYLSLEHVSQDQRGDLARIIKAVGGHWDKEADYAGFRLSQARGGLRFLVQADREQVCTRRVVATREVVRTVPAQPAMPAVSEHTVTELVEDVEWDCAPLLADRQAVTA